MTHAPPVPDAQQAPWPIQEPPHAHADLPPVKPTGPAERDADTAARQAENWRYAKLGAGVAIGSAAILAACLYVSRDGKK